LCATVVNTDLAHGLIFSYGLQLASTAAAQPVASAARQTLEGLWWKQEANVNAFAAFVNPRSEAISANLTVSDAVGNTVSKTSVTVSPHGTKILDIAGLPQAAGSSGGLRVQYDGSPSDLLVSGGLRDDATGYSANIGFAPPPVPAAQTTTVSYAALGLMTGAADPMLSFPVGRVFTPLCLAKTPSGFKNQQDMAGLRNIVTWILIPKVGRR
jgi:hypothetical protein